MFILVVQIKFWNKEQVLNNKQLQKEGSCIFKKK